MDTRRDDEPVIRNGEGRDLAAINAIYNHYIRETAATFDIAEWDMAQRQEWFDALSTRGRYRLFVAEAGGVVVGYAASHPYRLRAAYDTTVEVSVYLRPGMDGRGIGQRLYARLFEALRGEDVHVCLAAITTSNVRSIAFHEAMGFTHVGTFHRVGRKFGQFHDVAWYERGMPLEEC